MFNDEKIILAFAVSLLISVYSLERIIGFSKRTNLMDDPIDNRKIHKMKISNLGGIGVFIASMFAYFAFSDYRSEMRPDKLFSITILLFFVGLKDDIEPVPAYRRLFYEFICAFFIIYITDVRILQLYGIFGIQELPYWSSFVLTSIFIVGCINAYNMIDGIDGLLGSLSLLAVVVLGIIFYGANQWLWTLLCFSVAGALIGFLIFNWQPASIFMGNGGSMFIGTMFACIALRFLQLDVVNNGYLVITMPQTITLGIISIPIFDMLSVFAIRIYNKTSPFNADKRHTHHRLLDLGFKQWQAVLILVAANICILIFAYFVQGTGALRSLVYTFLFCLVLELLLIMFHWKANKAKIKP